MYLIREKKCWFSKFYNTRIKCFKWKAKLIWNAVVSSSIIKITKPTFISSYYIHHDEPTKTYLSVTKYWIFPMDASLYSNSKMIIADIGTQANVIDLPWMKINDDDLPSSITNRQIYSH